MFLCDFILDDSSGVFWGLSDKILHCVTGPFVHWLMLFALLSDQNTPEWTLRDCSLVFNDDLTSINSTLEPFCVFHEVAMHQSVHVIDLDATCSFSKMEHPIRCVLVRLCDQTMRAACDDLKHRVSLDRQLQFLVRRAVEEAIVHRCDSGLIQGGFFWVGMHGEIGSNSVGSSGFAAVSGSGSWGFVHKRVASETWVPNVNLKWWESALRTAWGPAWKNFVKTLRVWKDRFSNRFDGHLPMVESIGNIVLVIQEITHVLTMGRWPIMHLACLECDTHPRGFVRLSAGLMTPGMCKRVTC